MSLPPVCILTAGVGSRMGALGDVVNKALLPLGEKAIISHIIDRFPAGTEFVIALGYRKEQVKAYLRMAHRGVCFTFCNVENYAGLNSGPGLSLMACKEALNRPFYFCPSDSLIDVDLSVVPDANWVALGKDVPCSPDIYCNMHCTGDKVDDIADKYFPHPNFRPFTGLMFIKDHQDFWQYLASNELKAGEYQVSNGVAGLVKSRRMHAVATTWQDLGEYDSYKQANQALMDFDFTKKDEFLYICNGAVVKFFADPDIIQKRVTKCQVKPSVFPKIFDKDDQFYAYDLIPGETVYRVCSENIFKELLGWLDENVWTPADCNQDHIHDMCMVFYKDKTLARLASFEAKYPNYSQPTSFNGTAIAPVEELLKKLDWNNLAQGVPVFMHGDLQFDNIIYSDDGRFTLIDWRQDFAGEIAFGDLYYDLAKMLGGIWLNYDRIKKGMFSVKSEGDDLCVELSEDSLASALEKHLEAYVVSKGLDFQKVRQLVGVIFLNMSPLHEAPFDEMLHAFGRYILQEAG